MFIILLLFIINIITILIADLIHSYSNLVQQQQQTQDYQSTLTQIRSLLASKRSAANLTECQRLLRMARTAATALQALAEVDGDYVRIQHAQARLDRELTPLQLEISRGGNNSNNNNSSAASANNDDLFYRPTDLEQQGMLDTEALMASSHALLRESQA